MAELAERHGGLARLVEFAVPAIDAAIEQAEGAGPLLLIEASPLAGYDKLSMLSRWTDLAAPRPRAVWLLVPQLCAVGAAGHPCRSPVPRATRRQWRRSWWPPVDCL